MLGYLAAALISGVENAALVGGLSAIGAALYSIGIPKDSILQYETDVKADGFQVMVRGTLEEIARAKDILSSINPSRLDMHSTDATAPADQLVAGNG